MENDDNTPLAAVPTLMAIELLDSEIYRQRAAFECAHPCESHQAPLARVVFDIAIAGDYLYAR